MNEQYQSSIIRFGFGLAAFIFLIGGPISGYFLGRIFVEAIMSATWPTTSGIVTKAQVGETGVGRYFADVAYTYRVGDAVFTGSRIRASDGEYNIRDGAVQAIDNLTVGKQVPVYYNPASPRQSVLQAGAGFQEYVLLLVPVGMFVTGVWSFRGLWRTCHTIGTCGAAACEDDDAL
jgi:hypothetical protein